MELGLSLGDASKPFSSAFMDKARDLHPQRLTGGNALDFSMGLSIGPTPISGRDDGEEEEDGGKSGDDRDHGGGDRENGTQDLPVQLELLPNAPVPRYPHAFPWPSSDNGSSEAGSSGQLTAAKGLDVNKAPAAAEEEAGGSSPNSAASSFQMDFGRNGGQKRDSDEDENGNTRKKLRLSKEQSVFLEESFKEHNTLNPVSTKQKLALAKQLNLRPRQVEVWFQNRRARTKLKQTEVDCEYLKRCCETLTEENRRLQKEVQELRALKTSNPFYMQLPATTLTMCPSCERVATNTAAAEPVASNSPRFYPLPQTQNHHHLSKTS